jgi:hypothetical protein
VIFQDGTDIYWARSRVLEYLNSVRGTLPEGVNPVIGPDATGVGWIFEYALVDDSGKNDLAQLRSLQDWRLRYALESVEGVAEVAPVGGFVRQYQIDLDPNKLAAYNVPISDVVDAVRKSNTDVGGKTVEIATTQFFVRGRGYIRGISDLEQVVLKVQDGVPVYLRNVAEIHLGPDLRYGAAELNGQGEVVGGIAVMRYGENALKVIAGIKKKIEEIKPSLPPGVRIVPTYDRSTLIYRAIDTLREKLLEESIVVAVISVLFLWHVRSALVAICDHFVVHPDAMARPDFEHHVAWGNCHSDRCDGRRRDYHGGKRPPGPAAVSAEERLRCSGTRAVRHHRQCSPDRRTTFVFLAVGHHSQLHPGLLLARAGRTTLSATGVHQDLLHVLCFTPWIGVGACPNDLVDPRQGHVGEKKSD